MLRKNIDCLEEIHSRCAHNTTVVQELDRLFSVQSWQQGTQLLCQDVERKSTSSCVPSIGPVCLFSMLSSSTVQYDINALAYSNRLSLAKIMFQFLHRFNMTFKFAL